MRGNTDNRFLHRLIETTIFRIAHIASITERSVAHHPGEHLIDFFVFADGPGKGIAIQIGQLSVIPLGKTRSALARLLDITGDFRPVGRRIEVGKVPFGQRPQLVTGGASLGLRAAADFASRAP